MGVGDEVPPAIEQLGAKVELIGADDLAWGNLSRFDTIVTGVRAYERRGDLRANNSRLLDYVKNGGTLIVQYNKFEFNEAQYGPYPAKVSNDRVTDEHAPVTILRPAIRSSTRRTRSPTPPGRAGCRSAVCISSSRPRLAIPGSPPDRRSVPVQQGREEGRAGRGDVRKRPLGVRRARPLARAAGRRRRRVSAAREPHQPGQAHR